MMQVAAHIFREYDVRGIVDQDITPAFARHLGRAFVSQVREDLGKERPTVVLGHDVRPSSPGLSEMLSQGMAASGARVLDIGLVPTPTLYFGVRHLKGDAGIAVTASHNPSEYNGFKMLTSTGPFYGPAIEGLRKRIEEERYLDGEGSVEPREVLRAYVDDVCARFDLVRPVQVVIDCGNGGASLAAVSMLERIGARVDALYCTPDGRFPNHHPDPTVDGNLVDLIERVRSSEADLGVAFDGDADRIGVVDERGQIVRGDYLLLIYARDALRATPGEKVIFDVKCSQVLEDAIRTAGGEPIMWKTGHSLIKEKMRETGARLAGEMSGHMFFGDRYYGYDDALYAACRIVDVVARSSGPLSSQLADLPPLASTPEIRVECDDERKFEVVRRSVEHFRSEHEVIDVDGARVKFGDGWALIRASNTQPAIVLRFEAVSDDRLQAIRAEVETWLREQGVKV